MTQESLAAHRLALARDLLDDIELARLAPESLLLKASRLARLMDASEIQEWLSLELKGYPLEGGPEVSETTVAVGVKYGDLTGRVTNRKTRTGYWEPFAGLLGSIRAMEVELQSLQVPDIHYAPSSANPDEFVGGVLGMNAATAVGPANAALNRMAALTNNIATLRGVNSKIMALLHEFIATSYYDLAFGGLAEGIFEYHRRQIDALLAAKARDVLSKIPAIMERLAAGDSEAVSHAMTTGRRVLSSIADAIQPPSSEKLELDGRLVDATTNQYLNRLDYFLSKRCGTGARRTRLRHTLRDLNDRFSAATHADIGPEEARALFVVLYVTLGELLALGGNASSEGGT